MQQPHAAASAYSQAVSDLREHRSDNRLIGLQIAKSPGQPSGNDGRVGAFPTASFAQYPRSGRGTFMAVHTRARYGEDTPNCSPTFTIG